jgi:hypothetical protein
VSPTNGITKVALAIVTLGMIATVVVNGSNASKVVTATTGGFANSISAAEKG